MVCEEDDVKWYIIYSFEIFLCKLFLQKEGVVLKLRNHDYYVD